MAAGDEVLCIVVSSHLSGTINAAMAAAQSFPAARIEVYDSKTVAGGLGMMVQHARAMAQRGAPLRAIVESLDAWRDSQHLYACLSDLSHLQRTGAHRRGPSRAGNDDEDRAGAGDRGRKNRRQSAGPHLRARAGNDARSHSQSRAAGAAGAVHRDAYERTGAGRGGRTPACASVSAASSRRG